MENRNGLITFGIFVLLSAFTFVFCLDALSIPSTEYGILALIGYVVVISVSLFNGYIARKNGEALSVWFNSWVVIMSIAFVWFLTRCGTAFGWW
jgi:hypothetical protein